MAAPIPSSIYPSVANFDFENKGTRFSDKHMEIESFFWRKYRTDIATGEKSSCLAKTDKDISRPADRSTERIN